MISADGRLDVADAEEGVFDLEVWRLLCLPDLAITGPVEWYWMLVSKSQVVMSSRDSVRRCGWTSPGFAFDGDEDFHDREHDDDAGGVAETDAQGAQMKLMTTNQRYGQTPRRTRHQACIEPQS